VKELPLEDSAASHGKGCCAPARGAGRPPVSAETDLAAKGSIKPVHEDVLIPGGTYVMGDAFGEGYPGDGESPTHEVRLSPISIDPTTVTNQMFAAFIAATGYRTEAELYGSSAVFHLLSTAKNQDVLGAAAGAPWWLTVALGGRPGPPRSPRLTP
jgi:hypothetical protein